MAEPCACRSLCLNSPPINKDELVEATPTKGNSTPTPTPAMSHTSTLSFAIEMAATFACQSTFWSSFPLVKNELNWAVSMNDGGICNAPLLPPDHLFTETLKKLNKLQTMNSDSYTPTVNISYAHLLALPLRFFLPTQSHSNGSWRLNEEPQFRLKRSLENNPYRLASQTFVTKSLT